MFTQRVKTMMQGLTRRTSQWLAGVQSEKAAAAAAATAAMATVVTDAAMEEANADATYLGRRRIRPSPATPTTATGTAPPQLQISAGRLRRPPASSLRWPRLFRFIISKLFNLHIFLYLKHNTYHYTEYVYLFLAREDEFKLNFRKIGPIHHTEYIWMVFDELRRR
ncbi:hypothetical protein BRADI_1g53204v3 [Brachypodium distachyon]|nr:hypothetical protein BRADI_1g53204v3 [Brachypodium distachyon]